MVRERELGFQGSAGHNPFARRGYPITFQRMPTYGLAG
jgi:hypothetical protein